MSPAFATASVIVWLEQFPNTAWQLVVEVFDTEGAVAWAGVMKEGASNPSNRRIKSDAATLLRRLAIFTKSIPFQFYPISESQL